nr:stage II sporulation protein R [Paenibacillus pini]
MRSMVKDTVIIMCILFMLVVSWDAQKTDAAVAEGSIPQESIRLRILANSDSTTDQLVKREIRDAVVAEMNSWVKELEDPQSLDQARATIREHMSELNMLVSRELSERDFHYGYDIDLGIVPFPTKLYGGTVYPAGNYEALRITLGEGSGQNWWCVLFPPLCFIDAGSGDAAAQPVTTKDKNTVKNDMVIKVKADAKSSELQQTADGGKSIQAATQKVAETKQAEPQVRFFLWDLLISIMDWLKSLF